MIKQMEREYQSTIDRYSYLDMRAIEYGDKNEVERTALEAKIDELSFFIDHLRAGQPITEVREEWELFNSYGK